MLEAFKYFLSTFGWFGGFSVAIYFLILKTPNIVQGFDQLTERKIKKLEAIVSNENLNPELKYLSETILNEERLSSITKRNISEAQAKYIIDLSTSLEKRIRLKELLKFSEVMFINTEKNLLEFRKVSERRQNTLRNIGFSCLFITYSIIAMPIIFYPILSIFPEPLRYLYNDIYPTGIDWKKTSLTFGLIAATTGNIAFSCITDFLKVKRALIIQKIMNQKQLSYIHDGKQFPEPNTTISSN